MPEYHKNHYVQCIVLPRTEEVKKKTCLQHKDVDRRRKPKFHKKKIIAGIKQSNNQKNTLTK